MLVHEIMGGDYQGGAKYIHSLVSLFTHLGITGVILFLIMVYFVFSDIARCGKISNPINYEYQLLRLLMITLILFISVAISFVTWIPLWFVFGLFSVSFIRPRDSSVGSIIE